MGTGGQFSLLLHFVFLLMSFYAHFRVFFLGSFAVVGLWTKAGMKYYCGSSAQGGQRPIERLYIAPQHRSIILNTQTEFAHAGDCME